MTEFSTTCSVHSMYFKFIFSYKMTAVSLTHTACSHKWSFSKKYQLSFFDFRDLLHMYLNKPGYRMLLWGTIFCLERHLTGSVMLKWFILVLYKLIWISYLGEIWQKLVKRCWSLLSYFSWQLKQHNNLFQNAKSCHGHTLFYLLFLLSIFLNISSSQKICM